MEPLNSDKGKTKFKIPNWFPIFILKFLTDLFGFRKPAFEVKEISSGDLKGIKILADKKNPGLWSDFLSGRFESFIYDQLKSDLNKTGIIIWDIGAYQGYHALGFAINSCPDSKILAFEPDPFNFKILKQNIGNNPVLKEKIIPINIALTDKAGQSFLQSSIFKNNLSTSGSFLSEIKPPLESSVYRYFARQKIHTETIDEFILNNRELIPDIIKIDVEGAELLVLKGGLKLLAEKSPVLLMEIHSEELLEKVSVLLASSGYHIKILENERSKSRCFVLAKKG
jgi:FkbM family methyltransferase